LYINHLKDIKIKILEQLITDELTIMAEKYPEGD